MLRRLLTICAVALAFAGAGTLFTAAVATASAAVVSCPPMGGCNPPPHCGGYGKPPCTSPSASASPSKSTSPSASASPSASGSPSSSSSPGTALTPRPELPRTDSTPMPWNTIGLGAVLLAAGLGLTMLRRRTGRHAVR